MMRCANCDNRRAGGSPKCLAGEHDKCSGSFGCPCECHQEQRDAQILRGIEASLKASGCTCRCKLKATEQMPDGYPYKGERYMLLCPCCDSLNCPVHYSHLVDGKTCACSIVVDTVWPDIP